MIGEQVAAIRNGSQGTYMLLHMKNINKYTRMVFFGLYLCTIFSATLAFGDENPSESDERSVILNRRDLHKWSRQVRGFRLDHNFALMVGISNGIWEVNRFGTLESKKFSNSGIFAKFQYSFHLPIYKGFGYFLGSSFGYHYESIDRRRDFKPAAALMFPGILVGLVMNVSPAFRFGLGADAYLERHDGVKERDGVGDDPEISITLHSYEFLGFVDFFYDLNWALRMSFHHRRLTFIRPTEPFDKPVDANIKKNDNWYGVGIVYHLL